MVEDQFGDVLDTLLFDEHTLLIDSRDVAVVPVQVDTGIIHTSLLSMVT
jgi:hypothetical protein